MRTLRVFISSPGDVAPERDLAQQVIEELRQDFAGRIGLRVVRWEYEPLVAGVDPQSQVSDLSNVDIVVTILWSRLGTPLIDSILRDDGTQYQSGTEYEFETAVSSFRSSGCPKILVYRKTAERTVNVSTPEIMLDAADQKHRADDFFERHFGAGGDGSISSIYHTFNSRSEFADKLHSHLSALVAQEEPASYGQVSSNPLWQDRSPFVGLNVFEYEYAPVFFGRSRAVHSIIDILGHRAEAGCASIVVMGASGNGKSSVVRAGVLPQLCRVALEEPESSWSYVVFRPAESAGNPVEGLATSIVQCVIDQGWASRLSITIDRLFELARTDPARTLSHVFGVLPSARVKLVLLIDQLEELFSLPGVDEAIRSQFLQFLLVCAQSERMWVLMTLRSDHYAQASSYPAFRELRHGQALYDLPAPTPQEIGQMIRRPARSVGLRFEEKDGEQLDDVIRDEASKSPEVLPLLQFTLQSLYTGRDESAGLLTFARYEEIGGLQGSISTTADALFSALSQTQQEVLSRILSGMASVDVAKQDQVTRKKLDVRELSDHDGSNEIVKKFVDARLFVLKRSTDGNVFVEVAHEALLRYWEPARLWIEQNRDLLRSKARVTDSARRWIKAGKARSYLSDSGAPFEDVRQVLAQRDFLALGGDEISFAEQSAARFRHNFRLRRSAQVALVLLSVAAVWFGVTADQERNRANSEKQIAERTGSFFQEIFEAADPGEGAGRRITVGEVLDASSRLVPGELASQPRIQARMYTAIAKAYTGLGDYESASSLIENAKKVEQENGLANTSGAVATLLAEAELLLVQGNEQALQIFEAAMNLESATGGVRTRQYARALWGYASAVTEFDDPAAAATIFQQALAIDEQQNPVRPLDIAKDKDGLGRALIAAGKFEEAKQVLGGSLALIGQTGFMNRTIEAYVYNDLGVAHYALGGFAEALAAFGRAVELNEKELGADHPDLAAFHNNIGRIRLETGDISGAKAEFAKSQHLFDTHKPDDTQYVFLLNSMGIVNQHSGDLVQANLDLTRALQLARGGVPNTQVNRLMPQILIHLAEVELASGAVESARQLANEASEVATSPRYDDGTWRRGLMHGVEGLLLLQSDDFAAAETKLRASLVAAQNRWRGGGLFVDQARQRLILLYSTWDSADADEKLAELLRQTSGQAL